MNVDDICFILHPKPLDLKLIKKFDALLGKLQIPGGDISSASVQWVKELNLENIAYLGKVCVNVQSL